MKTPFDLPPGLVREIKLRAVHEGRKLKDMAAELLKRAELLRLATPPALLRAYRADGFTNRGAVNLHATLIHLPKHFNFKYFSFYPHVTRHPQRPKRRRPPGRRPLRPLPRDHAPVPSGWGASPQTV